ncbi:Uncharacterized protein Fot_23756 [Forsythia ovata]|uniref:RNA helicase n=1 Tax=Forsythia ovata TaxID=205694 RepID=A0ABD1U4Z8_9LAMI
MCLLCIVNFLVSHLKKVSVSSGGKNSKPASLRFRPGTEETRGRCFATLNNQASRSQLRILPNPVLVHHEIQRFLEYPYLLRNLAELRFKEPTSIQREGSIWHVHQLVLAKPLHLFVQY